MTWLIWRPMSDWNVLNTQAGMGPRGNKTVPRSHRVAVIISENFPSSSCRGLLCLSFSPLFGSCINSPSSRELRHRLFHLDLGATCSIFGCRLALGLLRNGIEVQFYNPSKTEIRKTISLTEESGRFRRIFPFDDRLLKASPPPTHGSMPSFKRGDDVLPPANRTFRRGSWQKIYLRNLISG